MKKNNQQVNGVKIFKTYTAATAFTGILSLLFIAVPILFIFFPWVDVFTGSGDSTIHHACTGLDLVKNLFGHAPEEFNEYIEFLAANNSTGLEDPKMILNVMMIACGIVFLVLALLSVISALIGLFFIVVGRVGKAKSAYIFGYLNTICIILFCGTAIAAEIVMKRVFESFAPSQLNISYWLLIICMASSLIDLVILGFIYRVSFKDRVYVGNLNEQDIIPFPEQDNNKQIVIINGAEPDKITANSPRIKMVKFEKPKGLPSTISSIGGHAFANNQDLAIAVIPNGIKALGNGAFANCGGLKVVSIPRSVKEIGRTCFFNCQSLQRINYSGYKSEWSQIKRGDNWLTKAGTCTIICLDGPIVVDPYH